MDAPADLTITMTDIMNAGFCPRVRWWFREHGLEDEYRVLVKGGSIPASVLLATGDGHGEQVVARKLARG
jgi:hypothetical protein